MGTGKTTRPLPTTFALLLASMLSSIDTTVVGTALPGIVGQLGGFELYPWVFSIYLLTATVTVPLWGKLADLFGRRPAFVAGISLFLVGSAACGVAPSMTGLIVARALQGLGAGAIFPVSQTIFGDIFPVEKRARMQGLFSLVWGVSSIIGPAVGGAIVSWWSWRWVFYVNIPLGVMAVVLFVGSFHEQIERRRRPLDLAGAALLCAAVTLLLAALPGPGAAQPWLAGIAMVLLGLFIAVERRAPEPILPLDLFRDSMIAVAASSGLLISAVMYIFIAFIPLFFQGALGYTPVVAGLVMAPLPFAWSAAVAIGGRWALRSGFRVVVRAGVLLIVLGVVAIWGALVTLPAPLGWILYITGTPVLGGGLGMGLSAFIISVQDRVSWQRRGAATAILMLLRSLGAAVGVAALGAVFTAEVARRLTGLRDAPAASTLLDPRRYADMAPVVLAPARAALGHALSTVFALSIGIAVLAFGLALLFPNVRPPKLGP